MRVGVLTFHLGPNHGGYQQAFCLCRHIRELGHDVEIINYKNPVHHAGERFQPWVYRRPTSLYHAWVKHRVFAKAYRDLPLSPFTTDVNGVDWARYDAVVVGSDVVWDYSWPRLGRDPVYFGHFGDAGFRGKLISYAPSIGTVKPDDPVPDWVAAGLRRFDAISARDVATAEMVERVSGRQATDVVDPTWLDLEFREPGGAGDAHLVVYAFHLGDAMRDAIVAYAGEHGLRIVALGYPHKWAHRNLMKLGPMEWLPVMRRAAAVVAGTFHGTLYAMNLQCRFATVLNERIMTRIEKPLRISGLQGRGVSEPGELGRVLQTEIDYRAVMDKLTPHVRRSQQFLSEHLAS